MCFILVTINWIQNIVFGDRESCFGEFAYLDLNTHGLASLGGS